MLIQEGNVQSSEKRLVRGLVKFVPAFACLFCLALLGTYLVESAYLISEPCRLEDEKGKQMESSLSIFLDGFLSPSARAVSVITTKWGNSAGDHARSQFD